MQGNCENLKIRSRKYQNYFYCTKKHEELQEVCHRDAECYQQKPQKSIKRVSGHKESVSPETYKHVIERDNHCCALCGKNEQELKKLGKRLHYHHINGRGRGKTDDPANGIMLCEDCHLQAAHTNNTKYRPILNQIAQGREKKVTTQNKAEDGLDLSDDVQL